MSVTRSSRSSRRSASNGASAHSSAAGVVAGVKGTRALAPQPGQSTATTTPNASTSPSSCCQKSALPAM